MQATQTTSTDIMGTFIENLNDIALTNDTAAKRHIFEFIVEEYLPDNFPELLPGWLEEIGNNAIHGYCAETGKWPDNDYS